eukprot:m.137694 g.137694  ORF g.137694 m.137694 type:complete len:245 (-) comp12155_c0_seq1:64-798(-)
MTTSFLAKAVQVGACGTIPDRAGAILSYWFGTSPNWPASTETTEEEAKFEYLNTMKEKMKIWFMGGKEIDEDITSQFKDVVLKLKEDRAFYKDWVEHSDPRCALSLIVLTDQMTRNIFRGTGESFAFDDIALETCKSLLDDGRYKQLRPIELSFMLLPLEHSEDLKNHEIMREKLMEVMANLESLGDEGAHDMIGFMQQFSQFLSDHSKVLEQFGRYPHRNKVLGRESTEEEVEYLKTGSSWGQ